MRGHGKPLQGPANQNLTVPDRTDDQQYPCCLYLGQSENVDVRGIQMPLNASDRAPEAPAAPLTKVKRPKVRRITAALPDSPLSTIGADSRLLLRETELLRKVGFSRRTALDLRTQGLLPYIRLGKRGVRYWWPSVQQALLRLEQGGSPL